MKKNQLNTIELNDKMKTLAQNERDVLKDVLLTIKEIDARKMYLEFGYSSLFEYLVQAIGYSEGSAQRRIDAARMLRDLPQLADEIQTGAIKLSQISMVQRASREVLKTLGKKVSPQDKQELLKDIAGQNSKESQKEIANFFDLPIAQKEIQKFQKDDSVRMEITLTKELFEKVQKAQALLSHSLSSCDLTCFLEFVSDKIIKQKTASAKGAASPHPQDCAAEPLKTVKMNSFASGDNYKAQLIPRANFGGNHRHGGGRKSIPAILKKNLLNSDQGCQFVSPQSGKICGSKWHPQIDHRQPIWSSKDNDMDPNRAENLQVLCAAHNQLKYRSESRVRLRG